MKNPLKKLEVKKIKLNRKAVLIISALLIATLVLVVVVILQRESPKDIPEQENEVTDVFSHENSGPVLEQNGDFEEAARAYIVDAEEIDENELKPELYEKAGDAYRQANSYEAAISAYQKAAELYKEVKDSTSAKRAESKIDAVRVDIELTSELESQDEE